MAKQEQIELLRQGIDVWNEWRTQYPDDQLDLSEADLNRSNLSGAFLTEAMFIKTNLTGAVLTQCSIYGISVWNVQLAETRL